MPLDIKILGPGCKRCDTLLQITREVVEENNVDAKVTKIEELTQFISFGIIKTPGLVINGKLVLQGYLPSKQEIVKIIEGEF